MLQSVEWRVRLRKFVVFGAGGHALSIADLLSNIEDSILYFCTDLDSVPTPEGYERIPLSVLKAKSEDFEVVIGVGDSKLRQDLVRELIGSNCKFPALIHPRAYVSKSAKIGIGTVVFSNCYIGPKVEIGEFVIVNTNTVVEHNSKVASSTILSPSVTLAGNVVIGERTFVGMGVSVSPMVQIGNDCIIGASSFINVNISNNSKAFGSPLKISLL